MNPDTAAANLIAITDNIVVSPPYFSRLFIKQGDIFIPGCRKGVVLGFPAPRFFVPAQQWKAGDKGKGEPAGVGQFKLLDRKSVV